MPHMPATGKSGVDVYQRTGKDGWWYVKPPWWAMPYNAILASLEVLQSVKER